MNQSFRVLHSALFCPGLGPHRPKQSESDTEWDSLLLRRDADARAVPQAWVNLGTAHSGLVETPCERAATK